MSFSRYLCAMFLAQVFVFPAAAQTYAPAQYSYILEVQDQNAGAPTRVTKTYTSKPPSIAPLSLGVETASVQFGNGISSSASINQSGGSPPPCTPPTNGGNYYLNCDEGVSSSALSVNVWVISPAGTTTVPNVPLVVSGSLTVSWAGSGFAMASVGGTINQVYLCGGDPASQCSGSLGPFRSSSFQTSAYTQTASVTAYSAAYLSQFQVGTTTPSSANIGISVQAETGYGTNGNGSSTPATIGGNASASASLPSIYIDPTWLAANPGYTLVFSPGFTNPANAGTGKIELAASPSDFGTVALPGTQTLTLAYLVNKAVTFGTPYALTDGVSGFDFSLASANTCTGTLAAGSTCSITVTFTPSYPGLHKGAVQLFDSSGFLLATTLIQGTGTAPQVAFAPARQATVASQFTNAECVAADRAGNIFVCDAGNNQVVRISVADGSRTTVGKGLSYPRGVAIDGAGDIFIADNGNNRVVEVSSGGGAQTTVATLTNVIGVAVDGAGNLYMAAPTPGGLMELPAGSSTPVAISYSGHPQSLAVDAAGNLLVGDTGGNLVLEFPAGGGLPITLASGAAISQPSALAVDAAGNLFISCYATGNPVVELPAGGGPLTTVATGLSGPDGLALDAVGNILIADTGNGQANGGSVFKVSRSQSPALNFPSTLTGTSSSAQSVTVQNIGNAPLTATGLTLGSPFAQVAGGGTPADCTASSVLAPGGSCNLSVGFNPTQTGPITGAVSLTDNSLNGNASVQTLTLSGYGVTTQTITFPAIANQVVGTPLSLVATTNSGLPISFSSSTLPVCTVSGATATFLTAGTCTITASAAANGSYAAATPVTVSFSVTAAVQAQYAPPAATYQVVRLLETDTNQITNISPGQGNILAGIIPTNLQVASGIQVGGGTATASAVYDAGGSGPAMTNSAQVPIEAWLGEYDISVSHTRWEIYFTVISPNALATQVPIIASGNVQLIQANGSLQVEVALGAQSHAEFLCNPSGASGNDACGPGSYQLSDNFPAYSANLTAGSGAYSGVFTLQNSAGAPYNSVTQYNCAIGTSQQCLAAASASAYTSAPYIYIDPTWLAANPGYTIIFSPGFSNTPIQLPQTITFAPIANQAVGTPLALTASASSNLAVTYTSSTLAVCTVSGATATFLTPGTCNITASQPGNTSYQAATPVTQSFQVLAPQTITFAPIATQVVGTPFAPSATASSGLGTYLGVSPATVCNITGGYLVHLVAPGTCTITASQPGNGSYLPATPVTQSFTVVAAQQAQTITFGAISSQDVGAPLTLTATASSGLPVSYSSSTQSVCTVSGSTATFLIIGTCTITASQSGSAAYAPATPVTQSFSILAQYTPPAATYNPILETIDGDTNTVKSYPQDQSTQAILDGLVPSTLQVTSGVATANASFTGSSSFSLSNSAQVNAYGPSVSAGQSSAFIENGFTVYFTVLSPDGSPAPDYYDGGPPVYATGSFQLARSNDTSGTFSKGYVFANYFQSDLAAFFCEINSPLWICGSNPYKVQLVLQYPTASQPYSGFVTVGTQSDAVGTRYYCDPSAGGNCYTAESASASASAPYIFIDPTWLAANPGYSIIFSPGFTNTPPAVTQTITFPTIAAQTVGAPLTLTASSTSNLPITYSSSTTAVCSVSGTAATFLTPGTCTITASQPGNTGYQAATPVTQSFQVFGIQTITFANPGAQTVGTPLALLATASSGLPVSFTSSTLPVCTVSGSTATFLNAGTCSITAAQGGNSSYAAAASVSQTFSVAVSLKSQSITFGGVATQTVGTPLTLAATASSGLAIAYAASPVSVCNVSGSTATFLSSGNCTVTASQTGNSTYSAATPVSQTFAVLATQTITFPPIATQTVGIPFPPVASASSGLSVNFSVSPATVCALYSEGLSGLLVHLLAAGTCTITASQPGNSTYSAATSLSQTFAVLATQTITFANPGAQTVGTPLTLLATASSSLPVSFTSSTLPVCTVSGSTATFLTAGTCSITAAQAGNASYAPATSITQAFNAGVSLKSQTVTFGGVPTQTVGTPLTLSATSSSALAVTYAASPSTVCAVSGSTATFLTAGSCTITASQAGNSTYAAATPVSQTFAVLALQTITFANPGSQTVGTPLTLAATATSGLAVSYASTTLPVCTVSGSTATFLAAGTCSITASQAGNTSYAAAVPVMQSFTVAVVLKSQTITFGAIPTQTVGTLLTLGASASSGLAVTYAASPATVCAVNGNTTTFLTAGSCTITASQTGNSTYSAATPISQTFAVLATQTITFANPGAQSVGTPLNLLASATSGLPVSFTSSTLPVCSVSGSTATFLTAGTCTVSAAQGGNASYAAATPVTQSFSVAVALKPQTITFGTISTQTVGTPLTLGATASSGLAVTYAASPATICAVGGSTATFLTAGSCTITASQAGNTTYSAATPVSQTFAVLATQTITFANPGAQGVGTPLSLLASATSGLPVSFTSSTLPVCTVSGSIATFLTAGTCTISAAQGGNASYAAATPVTQSFNVAVALKSQTITFGAIPTQTVGTPLTLGASASSGLAVTYAASPATVCAVSGSTATFLTAGNCTIAASQAGNTTYSAATPVSQTFSVVATALKPQTITFAGITSQTVGSPLTLIATASSGLSVSYTSSTLPVCTVSGSIATLLSAGTCTIMAVQPGNSVYGPAPAVTQSFSVLGTKPLISNVTATSLTSNSATIVWTTDQAANSLVNYGTTTSYGSTSGLTSAPVTGHSISLSGLNPGTTYNFDVVSANASNAASTSTNYTFSTPASTGPIPFVSYVAYWGITNSGITISWSTNTPATTQLLYGTSPALGQTTPLQTNLSYSHGVTLTGLAGGTTYYFVAQSTANGVTGYSTTYSFTTSGPSTSPVPIVSNVQAAGITNTSAVINWTTDQPTSSQVNYGTTTSYGTSTTLDTTFTTSHSVSLTGLTLGTVYNFDVVSANASSISAMSPNQTFQTSAVAGPTPNVGYVAEWGITSSSASISWSTDIAANTSLKYGTTTALGQTTPVQSALTRSHGVALTGLTSGTTYYFQAQSTANGPSGSSSILSFTTSGIAPTATPVISNVAAKTLSDTSAIITWTTDQATTSLVNYGTSTTYSTTSTLDTALVTSHSVTLTGLTAGTTYDFRVVSANAANVSVNSVNATFATTKTAATPPNVGYVAFWGVTSSGVTISWSTDVPATTQVAYGTTPSLGQLTPVQTALTSSHGVVLTGLSANTTYYFVGQSTGANGATGASTTYTFTTGK